MQDILQDALPFIRMHAFSNYNEEEVLPVVYIAVFYTVAIRFLALRNRKKMHKGMGGWLPSRAPIL